MAASSDQLRSLGIDSLAIVGTELDNARLYFKFRPTRLALGADPHLTTHRSYGVPRPEPTPELAKMIENTYINPTGELPAPLPVPAAAAALAALDGYQNTPTDQRDQELDLDTVEGPVPHRPRWCRPVVPHRVRKRASREWANLPHTMNCSVRRASCSAAPHASGVTDDMFYDDDHAEAVGVEQLRISTAPPSLA